MANLTAPRRVIMRIELLPQAKQGLADMCERLGMTQVSTTSRIIEWFTSQPDIIQAAILGLYPEDIKPDVMQLIMKRLGGDKKK